MSSSVLVVVIVGCIVVVVARMAITEAQKPATRSPRPDREEAAAPLPAAASGAAAPDEADERVPAFGSASPTATDHLVTEPLEPLAPTWAQRARATVLLGITVVVLGSIAAGLIGGALYFGLRTLDRALG